MTVHDPDCGCDLYGCQMRRKGINLSYDASPTRRARRRWRPKVDASWEAGIAGEHRPGGEFMPYLDSTGTRHIRVKEAAERRVEISQIRERQRQGPAS